MRRLMDRPILGLALALVGGFGAVAQNGFVTPRIPPLDAAEWSTDVRDAIRTFGVAPDDAGPLLRSLAHHPAAIRGLGPLARFLREGTMVTAVDHALLGLRIAWLTGAEALWAEQADTARSLGLTETDLQRVTEGPEADWLAWDATVVRAADELYYDSFLGDATWNTLASRYDAQQLIELIFAGAEHLMLAMLSNSLGVQPDPRLGDRFPRTPVVRPVSPQRHAARLAEPRIAPLPETGWTAEVQALLDPDGSGGPVLNLYRTLARHPRFYRPRAVQSAYIRTGSTLSGRVRELLILRIGWLCGAEYEWAQHVRAARRVGVTDEEIRRVAVGPDAEGWTALEQRLLTAADKLYRDATVSESTWHALAADYDSRQLIDVLITVAGYRMVSIALNTLGTPLEEDRQGFPADAP